MLTAKVDAAKGQEAVEPTFEIVPAFAYFRDIARFEAAAAAGAIEFAETEDEFFARAHAASVPAGAINPRIANVSDLPEDRTFRNAWTDEFATPTIDVDMTKAREIVRDRLRQERKPLLESLDIEYQRADESGDAEAKARIAAEKKKLRDITASALIADAVTPADLVRLCSVEGHTAKAKKAAAV
jgi:hypothetical protein